MRCHVGSSSSYSSSDPSARHIVLIGTMAQPAHRKAKTERVFLCSSESANEGYPDKICDQVSGAVLDACLALQGGVRDGDEGQHCDA